MSIKYQSITNRYTLLGLGLGFACIVIASLAFSHQLTGSLNLGGIIKAQSTSPFIWFLDVTPFLFSFCGIMLNKKINQSKSTNSECQNRFFKQKGELHVNYLDKSLLLGLEQAIEKNQLQIYYQPIIELSTGTLVGAEASVRFTHHPEGLLNAKPLIGLIEDPNLIYQLTSFILIRVIKQLAKWHEEEHKIYVSINLSSKDAIDRVLPGFIEKLLMEHDLAPEYLTLEFSEKCCLTDHAKSYEVLYQLSNLGVKIAIDDFCSGYSSFVYLTDLPVDEIKIEQSLCLQMNDKNAHMVEGIIKLAKSLRLKVVADGVVDESILRRLKELKCQYGQGDYFSKGLSQGEFYQLLSQSPERYLPRKIDEFKLDLK